MRIVLLTRQLGIGGAERQMAHLANGLAAAGHEVTVLSFYPGGALVDQLDQGRVRLICLGKHSRWDLLGFAVRFLSTLRALNPTLIYSFLTVPNLFAALGGATVARRAAVVWGIRGTGLEFAQYDWLARLSAAMERRLAWRADLFITNATSGADWLRAMGFAPARIAVVANGIDTAALHPPTPAERQAARDALGFAAEDVVVAVVARIDPMKDHATFLEGFAAAAAVRPALRALLAGDGPPALVASLRDRATRLGMAGRITWLGAVRDTAGVYRAADLLCQPSAFGEGFPNVIGEAMASGLPCIATRVGDAEQILGPLGTLIPPRDPAALARALCEAVDQRATFAAHGLEARERVVQRFGLARMVATTEALLLRTAALRRRPPP